MRHLGYSGLRLEWAGAAICVDPPTLPGDEPAVVTWTERERVSGVKAGTGRLAALPAVLAWLAREGVCLSEAGPVTVAGFRVRARAFEPIPYATPAEALRKTWSAARNPVLALGRLAFLRTRPKVPPVMLTLERGGVRVALLSQALHRFATPADVDAIARWASPADVVVAGTDYDDEGATGRMLSAFDAPHRVIADLTGPIRRKLGLPVRPLAVALADAPPGTMALEDGAELLLDVSSGVDPSPDRG